MDERQHSLGRRIGRTADLARTRVDVELQKQNRSLLVSMNRRAELQVRLQETVEGLSVVAISYYAVGLLGYLLKPILGSTYHPWALAIIAPMIFGTAWLTLRRFRKKLHAEH